MIGMSDKDGSIIDGIPYLRQRITDAIRTAIGTFVMKDRDRGSDLFNLIDAPMDDVVVAKVFSEVSKALTSPLSGIPDFRLGSIQLDSVDAGSITIALQGYYITNGQPVNLTNMNISFR